MRPTQFNSIHMPRNARFDCAAESEAVGPQRRPIWAPAPSATHGRLNFPEKILIILFVVIEILPLWLTVYAGGSFG